MKNPVHNILTIIKRDVGNRRAGGVRIVPTRFTLRGAVTIRKGTQTNSRWRREVAAAIKAAATAMGQAAMAMEMPGKGPQK